MRMVRVLGLVVIGVVLGVGGLIGQTPAKLDYDTYCKMPATQEKFDILRTISRANQDELQRTPYERFLVLNKSRLNAEQVGLLNKVIAGIGTPPGESTEQAKARQTEYRAQLASIRKLFTQEDADAMGMAAPCIPKAK